MSRGISSARVMSGFVMSGLFGAILASMIPAMPAAATEPVDLELVIATDVSRSIDEDEAQLQRRGIAAAFRSKVIIRAIQSGFLRRITVAYIDYSSALFNKVVVDWRILADRRDGLSGPLPVMAPLMGRSAAASIIAEPVAILARARSFLAPPAAMSARTWLISGASGVRSKVNFIRCCQTNANWSQYRPGDTRFMPKVDAIRPTRRCDFL